MGIRTWLLLVFACCGLSSSSGQSKVQSFRDVPRVDIPFDYQNNLIVVTLTFKGVLPLKFIFDTGAEHTILAHREITDLFGVDYEREFKLIGSDMRTELVAYLARDVSVQVGNLLLPHHSMLVLKEDYFHFKEITGLDIQGIIGADVFRGFIVHINYERRIISLLKQQYFKTPSNAYEEIPIEVHRYKPYVFADVLIKDNPIRLKLLIDTGASLSLLINTSTDSLLTLPENTIVGNVGIGLGGFLEGYLGRIKVLDFGEIKFRELITTFQDIEVAVDTSFLNGRNGIIGNQILDRFDIYIDYSREKLYLRPNRYYKDRFEFDKSGLFIILAGAALNSFVVHQVVPGSAADEAGIQAGDVIKRINSSSSSLLSLTSISNIFRKKEGKKIRMIVVRRDERLKFVFYLRNII
jgi:hypothetical protein